MDFSFKHTALTVLACTAVVAIPAYAARSNTAPISPSTSRVALAQPASATANELIKRVTQEALQIRARIPLIANEQIDANIDRTLSVQDRATMRDIMFKLPSDSRLNVTYFAPDGRIISNHANLAAQARSYPVRNGRYVDESGRLINTPPVTARPVGPRQTLQHFVRPDFSGGSGDNNSGPFRQEYSTTNHGYIQVDVYIPCYQSQIVYGDTPYAYVGGWGAQGGAEDAGLQYSPSNNWITAFSKYQNQGQNNAPGHLQCNKTAYMSFFPISYTQIGINVSGTSTSSQNYGVYDQTIVQNVPGGDGWAPACYGCEVKRMTSIAQAGDKFSDGSYFGVQFGFQPKIAWTQTAVGLGTQAGKCIPENPPIYYNCFLIPGWGYANSSNIGGFVNVPNDNTRLLVSGGDYYESETDGITLHP